MSEPKKRYPADRIKLHALLDKKENELRRLTEEVNQLRALIFDGLNLLFEFFNVRIVGVYGKHGLNDRKQICGDFLFL